MLARVLLQQAEIRATIVVIDENIRPPVPPLRHVTRKPRDHNARATRAKTENRVIRGPSPIAVEPNQSLEDVIQEYSRYYFGLAASYSMM
jgi:hypothetical protein